MVEGPEKRRDDRPPEENPFDEEGDDIVYSPVPAELEGKAAGDP